MLPQRRYPHPKFLQQDQSRRCCNRQRARSHQSGCPVLLFPFQACRTGQRRHKTAVPVACSSRDYMACHSQIFPSIWASVRSDASPVLARSAPQIRVLPMRCLFRVIDRDRGTPHGTAPPTPTGHTGPYHGGSIRLSLGDHIKAGRPIESK